MVPLRVDQVAYGQCLAHKCNPAGSVPAQLWLRQRVSLRHCTAPPLTHPAAISPNRAAASHADPLAASLLAPTEHDSTLETHTALPGSTSLSQQQLLDVAATFVKLWFAGISKGPQAVEQELARLLDPNVVIKPDRVKHLQDIQGLHEVLAELERAHLEYHKSEHRPMLYAASPNMQRAYALVEGTYQDVGALPGHPATFRISKVHHILSIQVEHGRIAVLWLYRQLTEEDKDELLREPLACYPAPFPRDCLLLVDPSKHTSSSDKMMAAVTTWWQAWASLGPGISHQRDLLEDNNESSPSTTSKSSVDSIGSRGSRARAKEIMLAVTKLLAPDFRMWDAYGLWPAMRAQGRRYLNKDAALRYMQSLSYNHNLELTVLDMAEAGGSLACFSHWQARLQPRWLGSGSSMGPSLESVEAPDVALQYSNNNSHSSVAHSPQHQQQQRHTQAPAESVIIVDGMAVDLFNDDMDLKGIWVFRGPVTQQEKQLFLEYDRQQAAAEAEQAANEQETIRAARRAQREQQLSELLAWMNNYQQQWSSYATHVQKQIARQQRLAKQQLIRQLQASQSLEASLEEEELLEHQDDKLSKHLQQQLNQAQKQLENLQQQVHQQLQSPQKRTDRNPEDD